MQAHFKSNLKRDEHALLITLESTLKHIWNVLSIEASKGRIKICLISSPKHSSSHTTQSNQENFLQNLEEKYFVKLSIQVQVSS